MTKLITSFGIALSLALSVTACSSAVDEIKSLSEEACACKDVSCGNAVNKKLEKALHSLKSESDLKEAGPALIKAAACLSKLGVTAN